MFYYYTKWICPDYDGQLNVPCHSTWQSPYPPHEFVAGMKWEQVLEYKKFNTLEEMEKFAKSVGLWQPYQNQLECVEFLRKLRKALENGLFTPEEYIEKLAQFSFENKISLDDCTPEERVKVRAFLMG